MSTERETSRKEFKEEIGIILVLISVFAFVYLNRLLLLENRCEVRQDEADILLLGALFRDQQHIGQHEGNHVQVDKLRGQCRQDSIHHHSLRARKTFVCWASSLQDTVKVEYKVCGRCNRKQDIIDIIADIIFLLSATETIKMSDADSKNAAALLKFHQFNFIILLRLLFVLPWVAWGGLWGGLCRTGTSAGCPFEKGSRSTEGSQRPHHQKKESEFYTKT